MGTTRRAALLGCVVAPQKATDDLMRSTSGVSAGAAARVAARAKLARRAVSQQCDRPSAAMRNYLRVAQHRSRAVLSHQDLDAVMSAYSVWVRSVGAGDVAQKLRRAQQGCRTLKRQVHLSYRVWWRWNEVGRVWWIQLTYRNGLARSLDGSLYGRVRVTDLMGERFWWRGRYRRSGLLTWGGSSADFAVIRPGTSQQLVAPGADPYVATGPLGDFEVENVEVTVGVPGLRSWWCSLPVPEKS
jgi:hypothetical protein